MGNDADFLKTARAHDSRRFLNFGGPSNPSKSKESLSSKTPDISVLRLLIPNISRRK